MDEYGYAAAMGVGLEVFEIGARRTGRTSRMIERLADGDQVIAPTEEIARHVRHKLKEAGKSDVSVFVVDPSQPATSTVRSARPGRTFFEHTWVRSYFQGRMKEAVGDLARLQGAMSKTPEAAPSQLYR